MNAISIDIRRKGSLTDSTLQLILKEVSITQEQLSQPTTQMRCTHRHCAEITASCVGFRDETSNVFNRAQQRLQAKETGRETDMALQRTGRKKELMSNDQVLPYDPKYSNIHDTTIDYLIYDTTDSETAHAGSPTSFHLSLQAGSAYILSISVAGPSGIPPVTCSERLHAREETESALHPV